MYSAQEVAEMFNVTRKTVYNWINAGYIRAVQVGGVKSALRISPPEVEKMRNRLRQNDEQIRH